MAVSSLATAQWVPNTSLPVAAVTDLLVFNNKIFLTAALPSAVHSSTDGLSFTAAANAGITGAVRSLMEIDGQLWAGTNGSNWFSSTDEGANWTSLGGRSGLISVSTVSMFKSGNNLVYGTTGNGGLHFSTNNGSSWSGSNMPSAANKTIHKHIVSVGGTLFASTLNGVVKSTDNGANWEEVSGVPTFNGTGTSLTAINGGLLLGIYGQGIHRSTDGGATWTKVLGGGLGSMDNNIITVSYRNGIALAGGAAGGVYYSTNNGSSWTTVPNTDMPFGALVSSVLYHNGYLYAGHNTGMARQQIAIASSTSEMNQPQLKLYPNPSQGMVHLSWPGAEELQVEIYNLSGQRVYETKLQGEESQIDAQALAKGVYLLRVSNPQSQQIQHQRLVIQ